MNKNLKPLFFFLTLIAFISSCKKSPEFKTHRSKLDSLNNAAFIGLNEAKNYALSLNLSNHKSLRSLRSIQKSTSGINKSESSNQAIDTVYTVKDDDGRNAYYIINFKPKGFCIVSADDRAPSILAYSETNSFDKDNGSEGVLSWMSDAKNSIARIRANEFSVKQSQQISADGAASAKKASAWVNGQLPAQTTDNLLIEYKDPLVQTLWGQSDGYNNECDYLSCGNKYALNGRALTGCVATAIAQIAAYHQYPASYNWSSMSNYYGTSETARLMHDIGVAVDMDYGCDGSGTDGGKNTVEGFNLLGYSMSKKDFKAFSATDPTNDFLGELRANRPFIISGGRKGNFIFFNTYKGGHEWVCDGFYRYEYTRTVYIPVDDYFDERTEITYPTYFHMNWGWDNRYNGWYMVGDFGPTISNFNDVYKDDVEGTYNYKNIMYYNIKPI